MEKMKNAFVILIAFITCCTFFCSCVNSKYKSFKITKAFIKSNQQIVDTTDNSLLNYPDSLILFSCGGYTVLYFNKLKVDYKVVSTENSDSLTLLKEEKQWFSYVYNEGIENGLFFDSLVNGTPAVLNTDSILRKHTPRLSISSDDHLDYWEQISELTDSSIITETYISKSKNDYGNTDTLKLYYSDEYEEVNCDLSKEMSNRKKHKLFKYSLVISESYDAVRKTIVPKRELFMEMGKINMKEAERENILKAIKMFDSKFKK
ncbi:MAG: hypothetical protein ACKVOM_01170 [Ferruginibacter sp.]